MKEKINNFMNDTIIPNILKFVNLKGIVALKDGKVVKDGPTDETIKKEELESIYEIKFDIQNIDNRKICVYF